MLAPSATIRTLNRNLVDVAAAEDALIEQFEDFGAMIKGIGRNQARADEYTPFAFFSLNTAALSSSKAENQDGEVPWVSSNDIITSAFLEASAPDVGLMAANLRTRLDAVGDENAGNYEGTVKLVPEDFKPPKVRRSIAGGRCRRVSNTPQMGPGTEAIDISVITNWASFAQDLVPLEGCEILAHHPVVGEERCLGFLSVAVIFQHKPVTHRCRSCFSSTDLFGGGLPG